MIYFGNIAQSILQENLIDMNYAKCRGYFFENHIWIAFDNRTGECYVEEFYTEEKAILWLEQYFEMSEADTFKFFKLFKGFYFIPNVGFIRIYFKKSTVESRLYPNSLRKAN